MRTHRRRHRIRNNRIMSIDKIMEVSPSYEGNCRINDLTVVDRHGHEQTMSWTGRRGRPTTMSNTFVRYDALVRTTVCTGTRTQYSWVHLLPFWCLAPVGHFDGGAM